MTEIQRPLTKYEERQARDFRIVAPIFGETFKAKHSGREVPLKARAHVLSEEVKKELELNADPKCYKCLGTGVKDWRTFGLRARVCRCVTFHTRSTRPGPVITEPKAA